MFVFAVLVVVVAVEIVRDKVHLLQSGIEAPHEPVRQILLYFQYHSYSYAQTVYNTKGTRAHTPRELTRKWLCIHSIRIRRSTNSSSKRAEIGITSSRVAFKHRTSPCDKLFSTFRMIHIRIRSIRIRISSSTSNSKNRSHTQTHDKNNTMRI